MLKTFVISMSKTSLYVCFWTILLVQSASMKINKRIWINQFIFFTFFSNLLFINNQKINKKYWKLYLRLLSADFLAWEAMILFFGNRSFRHIFVIVVGNYRAFVQWSVGTSMSSAKKYQKNKKKHNFCK